MSARRVLLALPGLLAALAMAAPVDGQGTQEEPRPTTASDVARDTSERPDAGQKPVTAPRKRRPLRIDDSNTGYIDNAIVGTQVRIRFDSAFDADRPDRAEFIYGKCICFTAFGQDGPSPGPARDLDFQEVELAFEYAFSERFSLFLEAPFRVVDVTFPDGFGHPLVLGIPGLDESGLGDLRGGLKYALVANSDEALTFQVRYYVATGDAAKALGTDHDSVEPGLLYYNQSSKRLAFASEARLWLPLDGSSDPLTGASNRTSPVGRISKIPAFIEGGPGEGPDPPISNDDFAGEVLRVGFGLSFDAGGARVQVSPVAEIVAWYVLGGFATPPEAIPEAPFTPPAEAASLFIEPADGTTIINLKLGARLRGLGPGSLFFGYGLALTSDDWYESIFRIEYRRGW